MSKLLAIADLHLTENKNDQYRQNFMVALIDIVARRKPDGIVILGDLTQEKDRHPAALVNQVVHYLSELAKLAQTVVLMGNHDYKNEGQPFFEFIERIPNLWWVGHVAEASHLGHAVFCKTFANCLFLPHTRNYEKDWQGIDFKTYRYIFAHQTFNGAAVGWGRELDGIPVEVFPPKARVIAGDIHVPQQLGPVTYVGAPYTVNFGDEYKPRMLALSDHAINSIGLGAFPQKRLVSVGSIEELKTVKGLGQGDILKVRVDVDDMATWSVIHKKVLRWAERHEYQAQRIEPVVVKHVVRKRHKINAKQSDCELLEQFGKRMSLTEATVKVGLELL